MMTTAVAAAEVVEVDAVDAVVAPVVPADSGSAVKKETVTALWEKEK